VIIVQLSHYYYVIRGSDHLTERTRRPNTYIRSTRYARLTIST
jgi:hypothetical protein